jgi:IMP dehydrogenase
VEGDGPTGKLVGIITNRDVRFTDNLNQPVGQPDDAEGLVTVKPGVDQAEARRLLHKHRIERLLVVDDEGHCVGLMTVKDMVKAETYPHAAKDEHGRLRVAAATTVGDKGYERAEALMDAGVDVVVIDTAHGMSASVLARSSASRKPPTRPRSWPVMWRPMTGRAPCLMWARIA